MGQITIDQSHQVLATLAVNIDWTAIDFEFSGLQDFIVRNPKEAGRQFTAFLKNGGKMMIGSQIISIDRTKPFDPAAFISEGWTIEEQDENALALTGIDLAKIRFETTLNITGEEKLKRLKKAGHIRLDAKIFQTLWENKSLIPESWKEKINGNIRFIFFDGTVLRNPRGYRSVLSLFWDGGQWDCYYYWLDRKFYACHPSAVLAS
jgi:hypothetical protein